ncbi:hypothetical protein V9T40_006943 [Parthenolecanium corni]|uniref:Uncharacterized protein n=1 Tax=Parthenolecanium corni TaxID=536013 RepID=A0AAN9TU17_9HEMI
MLASGVLENMNTNLHSDGFLVVHFQKGESQRWSEITTPRETVKRTQGLSKGHSIQYKEIKVTINKQEVERQLGLEVEKEEEVLDEEEYDASGFSQFAIGEII